MPIPQGCDDNELHELVSAGNWALAAPPLERVSAALTVLPKLVDALDRMCQRHAELRPLRLELTRAVREFREAVWDVQRRHREVTYDAAAIQKCLHKVDDLLHQLEDTVNTL